MEKGDIILKLGDMFLARDYTNTKLDVSVQNRPHGQLLENSGHIMAACMYIDNPDDWHKYCFKADLRDQILLMICVMNGQHIQLYALSMSSIRCLDPFKHALILAQIL